LNESEFEEISQKFEDEKVRINFKQISRCLKESLNDISLNGFSARLPSLNSFIKVITILK
jgi:hypothetical protein